MKNFKMYGDMYPVTIIAASEQEAIEEAYKYAASIGCWNWDLVEVQEVQA